MNAAVRPLSLDVSTTADDYAAFLVYTTRRPRRLAMHAGTFAIVGIVLILMQLAIGLLEAGFAAPGDVFGALRRFMVDGFPSDLATTLPWGAAGLLLIFCLNVLVLVPRQCRAIAARIVASYPSRSTENGRSVLVGSLVVGERGIENFSADQRMFLSWPLIRGLVETKRHVFIMTSRENAFVIPTADLDPATRDRLVETIGRRLSEGGTR